MMEYSVNEKYKFQLEANKTDQGIDVSQVGEGKYHVLKDNKSYEIELVESNYNQNLFSIKVNGNIYEVKAKNTLEQLLEKMGIDEASSSKVSELKAPMPGAVISIEVSEGQTISKGDPLLILEAMKMENVLKSPTDGVVKSILTTQGTNVDKNDVLVVFE